jgi:hypothetical protein
MQDAIPNLLADIIDRTRRLWPGCVRSALGRPQLQRTKTIGESVRAIPPLVFAKPTCVMTAARPQGSRRSISPMSGRA